MSETAILTAARAAVTTAMPTAKDWSDDPSDPMPDQLDAFVVSLTRDNAIPAAMGSALEQVQLTLEIEIFGKYGPSDPGRADMDTKGRLARAAILSDSTIAALTDHINSQTLEVDLARGETRMAMAAVTFSIDATI